MGATASAVYLVASVSDPRWRQRHEPRLTRLHEGEEKTATGEKIKAMKAEAARTEREAATLAKVRGLEAVAMGRKPGG